MPGWHRRLSNRPQAWLGGALSGYALMHLPPSLPQTATSARPLAYTASAFGLHLRLCSFVLTSALPCVHAQGEYCEVWRTATGAPSPVGAPQPPGTAVAAGRGPSTSAAAERAEPLVPKAALDDPW